MNVLQHIWRPSLGWPVEFPSLGDESIDLVLAFGPRELLGSNMRFEEIRSAFPNAAILLSTGAGEIAGRRILNDAISLTAVSFEKTQLKASTVKISDELGQREAGVAIASSFPLENLALILVISDGQSVNGSSLVNGINSVLEGKVPVVGGLAGDGSEFDITLVGLNELPQENVVAAIGFYGNDLEIGFGSKGGWIPFGPARKVTKSENNILLELDHKSALSLYKSYLGPLAAELPASALRFPLSVQLPEEEHATVRTVLSVDDELDTMTFAGDIPVGSTVRLMRAGLDKLLDGAQNAAELSLENLEAEPQLAILISCVGRRLVMAERAEEEVELVGDILSSAKLCGFYSYGEISPVTAGANCALHNQTMTVTTISEK